MKPPRRSSRRARQVPPRSRTSAPPRRAEPDAGEEATRLTLRRIDAERYALMPPFTALDRREDLEEVRSMIAEGELEIARDELLYLVADCRGFLDAHNLLGELALEEGDVSLAQGHFGFAYEIGLGSLPAGFRGRLPSMSDYNAAFFRAGRGTARCLIARGQIEKGREILERLAQLDPRDDDVQSLVRQLQERRNRKNA